MNLTTTADSVMMFCILALMAILDSFLTLLSILKKEIFVDQKEVLMKKTNKELKSMLISVEKISNLNKKQLVELIWWVKSYSLQVYFIPSDKLFHSLTN